MREIFNYYKKFEYPTEIMGASFRNVGEILALAGCDLLTISPALLAELQAGTAPVIPHLTAAEAAKSSFTKRALDEKSFRYWFNENAMATEKTAQGIRGFAADTLKLEAMVQSMMRGD